jgi:hypothetical protein
LIAYSFAHFQTHVELKNFNIFLFYNGTTELVNYSSMFSKQSHEKKSNVNHFMQNILKRKFGDHLSAKYLFGSLAIHGGKD